MTIPNEAWKPAISPATWTADAPARDLRSYTERADRRRRTGATDVYAGNPFPNNQIPTSRFPAYVNTYLNLWFPSTLMPMKLQQYGQFHQLHQQRREDNQMHARIDQKIADKNNLFGRVSWSDIFQRDPQNLPNAFQRTLQQVPGRDSERYAHRSTPGWSGSAAWVSSCESRTGADSPVHRSLSLCRPHQRPDKVPRFRFPGQLQCNRHNPARQRQSRQRAGFHLSGFDRRDQDEPVYIPSHSGTTTRSCGRSTTRCS